MSEQRVRLIDQLIQRAADELYEGKTPERVAGLLQILAGQEIGVQEARARIAQKFGRGKVCDGGGEVLLDVGGAGGCGNSGRSGGDLRDAPETSR